jgi:hypothetical protein
MCIWHGTRRLPGAGAWILAQGLESADSGTLKICVKPMAKRAWL